jgi:hypothetical protein
MNLEQQALGYNEEETVRDNLIREVISERIDLLLRDGCAYRSGR